MDGKLHSLSVSNLLPVDFRFYNTLSELEGFGDSLREMKKVEDEKQTCIFRRRNVNSIFSFMNL